MYSLPVLLATACSDANETQSAQNSCLYPGEDLQSYYQLLTQNPQILAAMELCERPASFQTVLWDKVREAEQTGLPPTAPIPQAYYDFGLGTETKSLSGASFQDPNQYQKIQMIIDEAEYDFYFPAADREGRTFLITDQVLERATEMVMLDHDEPIKTIYATRAEAHEILAAHYADTLAKEVKHILPWSIIDYDFEQLKELFATKTRFKSWDDKNEEYAISLVLDHSPKETFSVATEAVSSFSDQKTAMDDIIRSARAFRHGIMVSYDSEGNPTNDHDILEIVTLKRMNEEKISRHGCQTMSLYIVQLANSLNIPGRYINGYYYAAGHRSASFDYTDDVLAHGDDVYYYTFLGNTPSSEVMGSYNFWEENVLTFKKGDETAAHNSMLYGFRKAMQYPALRLIKNYCNDGREALDERFLDHPFGPFATVEEIDDLEKKILELSNNCTPPFPENKPD